jgi:hypothetical protein
MLSQQEDASFPALDEVHVKAGGPTETYQFMRRIAALPSSPIKVLLQTCCFLS